MPTLHMRLHPGLIPDGGITLRRRRVLPHFRQGDWDYGCGALSVLSAMVILGIATRAEIRTFRLLSPGRHETTFFKALESYFHGTSNEEMSALLKTLKPRLEFSATAGPMCSVCEFAVARLKRGEA